MKLWHQFLRQPFSSPAYVLFHSIRPLIPFFLFVRYLKILLTFLISNLLQLTVDLSLDMSLFESGLLRFFCTQAMGIMVEDAVQAAYRSLSDSSDVEGRRKRDAGADE